MFCLLDAPCRNTWRWAGSTPLWVTSRRRRAVRRYWSIAECRHRPPRPTARHWQASVSATAVSTWRRLATHDGWSIVLPSMLSMVTWYSRSTNCCCWICLCFHGLCWVLCRGLFKNPFGICRTEFLGKDTVTSSDTMRGSLIAHRIKMNIYHFYYFTIKGQCIKQKDNGTQYTKVKHSLVKLN